MHDFQFLRESIAYLHGVDRARVRLRRFSNQKERTIVNNARFARPLRSNAEGRSMSQINRSPKTYDVCVIGSGAGGGMAAKILTEGGLNCVLLEAGPNLNPEKDFKMFMWPYESPHRGAGVGGHARENFGEFLAPNGAWQIDGEPYTSVPGANFQWFRSRIVGGRTNHWGRIALRFAPIDFKSGSRDGLGDDWPITYE